MTCDRYTHCRLTPWWPAECFGPPRRSHFRPNPVYFERAVEDDGQDMAATLRRRWAGGADDGGNAH